MKARFKWRHQYDIESDEREGKAAATVNDEPSLTQQSFTEDADINVIARRFGLEAIPRAPLEPSHFRDTTEDPDLTTILQQQIDAKNSFMQLPAKLRRRFHDSPGELWAFVNDPENAEEAVRLGILAQARTAGAGAQSATQSNALGDQSPIGTVSTGANVPQNPPESPRP